MSRRQFLRIEIATVVCALAFFAIFRASSRQGSKAEKPREQRASVRTEALPAGEKLGLGDLDTLCGAEEKTFVCLVNEPGDGPGKVQYYFERAGIYEIRTWALGEIQFKFSSPFEQEPVKKFMYQIAFMPPDGEVLVKGVYRGASRFDDPMRPLINWHSNERWISRCNSHSAGQFVVHEVELDHEGEPRRLGVSFELRCKDDEPGSVFGRLCYNCKREGWQQGPRPPARLEGGDLDSLEIESPGATFSFQDAATACPNDRDSYMCLLSHAGTRAGSGRVVYLTPDDGRWSVEAFSRDGKVSGARVNLLREGGRPHLSFAFSAPEGEVLTSPRAYEDTRATGADPVRPVLAAGCEEGSGKFQVFAFELAGGRTLTKFGADFEIRCDAPWERFVGRICYWCK